MTTLGMFAAALLLPTLILTALAAIIGSILRQRRRRQAMSEAGIGGGSRAQLIDDIRREWGDIEAALNAANQRTSPRC